MSRVTQKPSPAETNKKSLGSEPREQDRELTGKCGFTESQPEWKELQEDREIPENTRKTRWEREQDLGPTGRQDKEQKRIKRK